ncbi:MAG: hypothetical protein NXI32_05555 [bacterium]|nr:hypothetical protein [bacterium]
MTFLSTVHLIDRTLLSQQCDGSFSRSIQIESKRLPNEQANCSKVELRSTGSGWGKGAAIEEAKDAPGLGLWPLSLTLAN